MTHQLMVYLIDQDIETRRSLSLHLATLGAEAWPFASAAEFLEIAPHLMPACILLDADLPDMSGPEFLAELAQRGIVWPVVAMSGEADVGAAVAAMKCGAVDFLLKPLELADLAEAFVPAWASLERIVEAQEARRTAQERVGRLTPREVDVSLALFAGGSNKAVAHEFGISVRTVEMHRAHIMAKLGVRSLAEAAVIATEAGLDLAGAGLRQARPPIAPGRAAAPHSAFRFSSRGAC